MYVNVKAKISDNENSLSSLIIRVKYDYRDENNGNHPVIPIFGSG